MIQIYYNSIYTEWKEKPRDSIPNFFSISESLLSF